MSETNTVENDEVTRLRRKLERARTENKALEEMIEEKTRSLYLAQESLRQSSDDLANVLFSIQSAVVITSASGRIATIGGTTAELTGRSTMDLHGLPVSELFSFDDAEIDEATDHEFGTGGPLECEMIKADGRSFPVLLAWSDLTSRSDADAGSPGSVPVERRKRGPGSSAGAAGRVYMATDVSERRRLEVELRHAQRMEAIGQLAAGVAHEINTPVQFVGDSIDFLGDVVDDLVKLVTEHRTLRSEMADDPVHAARCAQLMELEDDLDFEFLVQEVPKALTRTRGGIERITTIVGAMRQFSHTSGSSLMPTDVNEVIDNTLVVTAGQTKYVAEITKDLQPVPQVMADPGDLGQVLINLLVNACDAIDAKRGDDDRLGAITIATRTVDDGLHIIITDDGGGIPEDAQDHVFEPFFTTKDVGEGTGQGLSLCHNIVCKTHDGTIGFEVEPGVGTTFTVWLPSIEEDA
ncbi:MAG: ATP-binding protein [Actinomycetota bacterium]